MVESKMIFLSIKEADFLGEPAVSFWGVSSPRDFLRREILGAPQLLLHLSGKYIPTVHHFEFTNQTWTSWLVVEHPDDKTLVKLDHFPKRWAECVNIFFET